MNATTATTLTKQNTAVRLIKHNGLDRIFAFLFAVMVIVQPLRSFLPVTLSMAIIIASIPYILFFLSSRWLSMKSVYFVAPYAIFRIINHGTSVEEFITMLFLILLVIFLSNNWFDFDDFFKWTVRISCFASACLILQNLAHLIANIHIPFLNIGMVRDGMSSYETLISTGTASGVYRPSAFFIEPSAYTQYAYPVLVYLLFKSGSKRSLKFALLISIGIIASTSGMGIMLSVGLWGLYLFYNSFGTGKIKRKWFGVFIVAVLMVLVAYIMSPQLQYSVQRIFTGIGGQNSAIQGRLGGGQYYISLFNRSEFLFGTGDAGTELTMYMSGLYHLIYIDGVICAALFILMFAVQAIRRRGGDRLLPCIVILMTVFSDTTLIQTLVYVMIYVFATVNHVEVKQLKRKIKIRVPSKH